MNEKRRQRTSICRVSATVSSRTSSASVCCTESGPVHSRSFGTSTSDMCVSRLSIADIIDKASSGSLVGIGGIWGKRSEIQKLDVRGKVCALYKATHIDLPRPSVS